MTRLKQPKQLDPALDQLRCATVEQAAKYCSLSTKTVRHLINTGQWPHIRIGRQIRIDLKAVLTGHRKNQ